MEHTDLYQLNLASGGILERLSEILEPYLPFSLPVLGSLHCTGDELSSANANNPSLYVWSSFKMRADSIPPIPFSVITYSPIYAHQFRFFCSADSSPGVPSTEEEKHVVSVMQTLVKAVAHELVIVRGVDLKSVFRTPVEGVAPGIHIGSLHSKWVPCLQPHTIGSINLCLKFFKGPRSQSQLPSWDEPRGNWIVTQLEERDIELVRSRASFPRTYEFVASRCPWSVCIRQLGGDGNAVAWQLLTPDGSIGMLHVEPAYRRMGLGRLCIAALCRKLEQMYETQEGGKQGRYPYARWEFQDVVQGNEKSVRLITSVEGWSAENGWDCYWVYLPVEGEI